MTDTRMYGNQRRTIAIALASGNPFANPNAPTATEANAMLNISSVVKWNKTNLATQSSKTVDDRVLTDSAGAKRRGFIQFGGTVNLLSPKDETDAADIALQAFNIVKTPRTLVWVVDRVGPLNNTPFAAGDEVNVYQVAVDSKSNETSGDTTYSYTIEAIPQGDVFPNQILAASPAVAVTTSGHTTALSLATCAYTWGQAKIGSVDVTTRATWKSDNTKIATVDSRGLVTAVAVGSANITASYPGATNSTAIAITVSA